jgi:dCMP deaminase
MRPTWDDYFLGIAYAVAARADCSRAQVGAVIVKDHRIVATGYNGAPAGDPGCLEGNCPRTQINPEPGSNYDNCIALHAEQNALLYADRDKCEGAIMYTTRTPCPTCWKLIRGAGIRHTVSA